MVFIKVSGALFIFLDCAFSMLYWFYFLFIMHALLPLESKREGPLETKS